MQKSSKTDAKCRNCSEVISAFAETCPACGEAFPADGFVGRTIRGNILIESVIGSGGMGTVYKGVEVHLDRPVAVKILNATYLSREESVPYFNREAKVLSRLRHPNLVSVLDFGQEDDGTLYLVLEYIPGPLLFDLIHHGPPLEITRGLKIVGQILAALSEAHRHGVIHRDLKPGNVIIESIAGDEDFVKVLDFGIAKFLEGKTRPTWARVSKDGALTQAGMPVGTPEFMSPEQAKGLPLDVRSDIYGAGIMLYEILTRQVPFEGESVVTLLVRKVTEDIVPPSQLRAEIPPEIDRICLKACAQEPNDRFESAEAFREAIRAAVADMVAAPPARSKTTMGGFFSKNAQSRFHKPAEPAAADSMADLRPPSVAPPSHFEEAKPAAPVYSDLASAEVQPGEDFGAGGLFESLFADPSVGDGTDTSNAPADPGDDQPTRIADLAGGQDMGDQPTRIADLAGSVRNELPRPPKSADVEEVTKTKERSRQVSELARADKLVQSSTMIEANEFTVLIIVPVSVEDTPGRRQQLAALGAFVTEFIAESGGTIIPTKYAAVQVLYETARGQSSLVRAAETALRLRGAATKKFPFLRLKMGLHRGSAADGENKGSVGEAATNALELAKRAAGSQILAHPRFDKILKKVFQLELTQQGLEIVHLLDFGADQPEVTHERSVTTNRAAASVGLIGRREHRRLLDDAVEAVSSGNTGKAFLLHGATGMGKTHLVAYVRRLTQGAGLPFLEASGDLELIDRPFRPLLDVAILASGAIEDKTREDITGSRVDQQSFTDGLKLLGLGSQEAATIVGQFGAGTHRDPVVHAARSLTPPDIARAITAFPGRERRRLFAAAIKGLMLKLTAAGGAVVVLEDIDLADDGTLACLSALVKATRMAPLLLICTSEDTKVPGLKDAEALEVGPIPDNELESFMRSLYNASANNRMDESTKLTPAALKAVKLSAGSPFYLARYLEAPVQTPSHDVNLLLAAQVAELPQRIWRLIIIASLLGASFEETVFQGLFPGVKIRSVLEGAAMMGYFEQSPVVSHVWRFRSSLIKKAALLGLDKADRERCHRNIFKSLRKMGPMLSRRKLLLEALHGSGANLGIEAVDRCEELGDRFAVAGDPRLAEGWYYKALLAVENALKLKDDISEGRALDLGLKLVEMRLRIRRYKRASEVLDRLRPNDSHSRTRVTIVKTRLDLITENYPQALTRIDEGVAMLDPKDPLIVELLFLKAEHAARTGNTEHAIEVLYDAQQRLDACGDVLPTSMDHFRWLIPVVYGELAIDVRRVDHAVRALKLGHRRAKRARDSVGVVNSLRSLKYCMATPSAAGELVTLCTEALESKDVTLRHTQRLEVYRSMGQAHLALGERDKAVHALRQALGIANTLSWQSAREKIESAIARATG